MENRLTETLLEEEPARTCAWSDCDLSSCQQCNVQALVNRLAAYEDTNLTPSEIAEMQSELSKLREENRWIPVSERLPRDITNKVNVLCKNGYVGFGHYEKYRETAIWYNLESQKPFTDWDLEDCETYEVTHWRPLPQPPSTAEEGEVSMKIRAVTYTESREEYFQNRLNKARASLDNVVKYGTDPDACAEKGYIVSFYEDAITALREIDRLTAALAAKDELLKQAVEDIKCKDHCDVCKFSHEGSEDCETYDFDCQKCQSRRCVCRTCRDESKWQWREKKGKKG